MSENSKDKVKDFLQNIKNKKLSDAKKDLSTIVKLKEEDRLKRISKEIK